MKLIFWWHHNKTAIEVLLLRFFLVLGSFLYHYMYNCCACKRFWCYKCKDYDSKDADVTDNVIGDVEVFSFGFYEFIGVLPLWQHPQVV